MAPELLAPAGSFEKMKYAFKYGADACYLGMPDFSLRARLNDFTLDSVKESNKYAHKLNKKVYVTYNIIAHNYHIQKFLDQKNQIKEFLNGEYK
ncbi:U32 family peptidase, partial [Patescibacteria group bacterium]|nr:U32 family peptidase [Patescibacteria group bacterium]